MNNIQIHELALEKCNILLENNTQIRLTAEETSFWLFRKDDIFYIGVIAEEKNFNHVFFTHKKVLHFVSNKTGKTIAKCQYLISLSQLNSNQTRIK